jgi:hypothetical protein
MNEKLTGKIAYRVSWFRKLVLQVEVLTYENSIFLTDPTRLTKWRDATVRDVLELNGISVHEKG